MQSLHHKLKMVCKKLVPARAMPLRRPLRGTKPREGQKSGWNLEINFFMGFRMFKQNSEMRWWIPRSIFSSFHGVQLILQKALSNKTKTTSKK